MGTIKIYYRLSTSSPYLQVKITKKISVKNKIYFFLSKLNTVEYFIIEILELTIFVVVHKCKIMMLTPKLFVVYRTKDT